MAGTGSRYTGPTSPSIREKLEKAKAAEKERLVSDVNCLLQEALSSYNDRDRDKIADRLEELEETLGEEIEVDRVLFGGSVAKRTDVDGLSDTDALVILDRDAVAGDAPQELLDHFLRVLDSSRSRADVDSITAGRMAVTIKYVDGEEIQLLPALRTGDVVSVASPKSLSLLKCINRTKPEVFMKPSSSVASLLSPIALPISIW